MSQIDVAHYNKKISDDEFNAGVDKLVRKLNSYTLNVDNCQDNFIPFKADNKILGLINRHDSLPILAQYSDVFVISETSVELNPIYASFEEKTKIMEETLIDMREKKLFKKLAGWRNEHYYVRTKFSEKPLFSIERSAATTFGISSYGCHINGYIKRNGEYLMWIARRSKTKPTYPGKLDNFVAGGLTAGLSPSECATKELEEEAGLVGNELVKRLKQVDSISYAFDNKGLVNREGEFVFDIKLPEDFVPQNTDGEVECFYLMNIDQVKNAIINEDFKTNSAVVTLNFLMRKGLVTADTMPNYYQVLENMHASGL